MSDHLTKALNEEAAAIIAEGKALLAEQQGISALKGEAEARAFEFSEIECTIERDTQAAGAGEKLRHGKALNEEEARVLAKVLLPVVNARRAAVLAANAYEAAADKFIGKLKAHIIRQENHVAMADKFIAAGHGSLVKDMAKYVDEISGLISFGLAGGSASMDVVAAQFCQSVIEDFRAAKDFKDKRREFSNLSLAMKGLTTGAGDDEASAGEESPILQQFNAMPDGPERSEFYLKHKTEILAATR